MTRAISARIKDALLSQLEMERCNGIKTNWLINESIAMYLEFLDEIRDTRRNPADQMWRLRVLTTKWRNRIVYTIYHEEPWDLKNSSTS